MNRFTYAALTDEELAQYIDRFAAAAKLLKIDELKIEHKTGGDKLLAAIMPEATLMLRLGDRWLGTDLDWSHIEDMRGGHFDRVSRIALTMAKMLHDGAGVTVDKFRTVSRFAGVVGELDLDKEKP